MHTCAPCVCFPSARSEEGVEMPRTGVKDGCEVLGIELRSSKENPILQIKQNEIPNGTD